MGRRDEYVPGRSLTAFDPAVDVSVELSGMSVEGDFFNSTTNLHRERDCIKGGMNTQPTFGGMFAPPAGTESILDGPPQGHATIPTPMWTTTRSCGAPRTCWWK